MRKIIVSCVVIFCLISGGAPAQESAITLYLKASQLEQSGDYNGAYDIYASILKTEKSPTLYIKMADIEVLRGNHNAAYELLRKARKDFPADGDLAFSTGLFFMKRSEMVEEEALKKSLFEEAKKSFKDAVSIEMSEKNLVALAYISEMSEDHFTAIEAYYQLIRELGLTEYYGSLGLLKIRMGKQTDGIKDLEIAADNNDLQAILTLADIAKKENDTEALEKYLKMAAELKPDLFMSELYLGDIYVDKQEYDKALQSYMQAIPQMENGAQKTAFLKNVGSLAIEIKDYETAVEIYQMAIESTPDDSQLYYLAGYSAFLFGDLEEAQSFYDEGVKLYPEYAMLRKLSANNLLMLGSFDRALDVLALIDPVERDIDYYIILSNIYTEKDDVSSAERALKEGLVENPISIELLISLAVVYDKSENFSEAEAVLLRALEIESDNPSVLNFLGYMYADKNVKLNEAEGFIDRALEFEPDNYAFIDSKAWVLYRKGKNKEAYEYMKRAYEINPDDPEIIEHMRIIEKANGKRK